MAKKALIVESPTKARTIGRYLGSDYTVVSTVGHIRDLPKSSLGVDVDNGFNPEYEIIKGKAKAIKQIKDAIKGADEIFLAPDPDREGEAIAWHVSEILKRPTKRVEFHEITKRAVLAALENPREINQNLVNAYQARRIMDRLVGYKISPLMWRKIKRGLSAGRVQSVAVRLICEREEEIRAFVPKEYWTFEASFAYDSGSKFSATLVSIGEERLARPGEEQRRGEEGDGNQLRTIATKAEADTLVEDIARQSFSTGSRSVRQHSRRPHPPFTTSALQQDGAKKLGWTGKRTMSIAQQLYEGIDLGSGAEGLITYMRTDSVRVSAEALENVRGEIASRFGKEYLPDKPNFYKSKSSAQEAHEAIRPANAAYHPESIKGSLSTDQYKLYRLIHERFIASQMKPAEFETATLLVAGGPYAFRTSATKTTFKGFLAVYGEGRAVDSETNPVPDLPQGSPLTLDEVVPEQHITKPPPRYSDATLVKTLEEYGIGRPSTYAPIIETIIYRGYVVREKKRFEPTEWAFATTEMMKHYFPNIVDVNFTSSMEAQLDKVEAGEEDWQHLLSEFYKDFKPRLDAAAEEKKYFKAKPLETEHTCEKCGSTMLLRHGKYGRFLSCSAYPKCENIKNIDKKGNIVDSSAAGGGQEIERPCPDCGGQLLVKTSRWGTKFIGCKSYPKCKYTSELQNQCPKCGEKLVKQRLANRRVILVCSANESSEGKDCDFVLWGKPLLEKCPECGWFLAEQKIKGTDRQRRYCSNPGCNNHRGIDEGAEDGEEDEGQSTQADSG
ncbi:type I DNA topoisomerase [bacterium]|nr:type I DNA topoisomerase [bacterium]